MSPKSYRTAPPRVISSSEPRTGTSNEERTINVTRGWGSVKVGTADLLRIFGRDVLDDEQFFARLDQPELAAGQFLDGRRILAQPPRLLAEPGVLGAHVGQRPLERPVGLPRLDHCQQSLVADKRIDHQYAPGQQEDVLQHPAVTAARRFGGRDLFHG